MSQSHSFKASHNRPVSVALSVTDVEFIARICALSVAGVMGLGLLGLMVL